MPVSKDEALAYIGLTDEALLKFDDVEAFKTDFDGGWLKRDAAFKDEGLRKQVFGKAAGAMNTKTKQLLKDFGEEVSEGDLSKLNVEDFLDRISGAAKKHFDAQIKDLNTKLEGAKGDKSTKDLEKQLAEAIKHRDEYKGLSDDLKVKLENKDKEFVQTTRTAKENEYWQAAMGKAPFKKDIDPLTKTGFETLVRGKVKLMWDEEGKMYTADANGNRIKNTAKSNAFLELDEVIAAEVMTNKLNEQNPHAGKPVGATSKPSATSTQLEDKQPPRPMREIHPGAMAARQ